LSADANTVAIGGIADNSSNGAAWIFTRSGNSWSQQGSKLVGTNNAGAANQGNWVAISADGNTVMETGIGDNAGVGAAWIFTRSNGVWTQQGSKLVGTGSIGNSQQGSGAALSADGNTAVLGGPGDNSSQGAAWVFTRSKGVWTQQGSKLTGTGNSGVAYQAVALSLSPNGATLISGGGQDNSFQGAAWIFTASSNAALSTLTISKGVLSHAFKSTTTSYSVAEMNAASSITVSPTLSDLNATVTVNGVVVTSGSASLPIALKAGINNINVQVTAADGITTQTYALAVTRAPSANAYLSNLKVNTATLSPAFAFKTLNYTSSVPSTTASVTFTPALLDTTASSIKINGYTVANKTASMPLGLPFGTSTFDIVVTAQDSVTTQTYTVSITRPQSTVATLSNLQISSGTLSPVFASGTTSYAATVATTTTSITVTPTTTDTTAIVTVNGQHVTSKTASPAINLAVGTDTIKTVVTAQDGVTRDTYTLIVTRDAPGTNNAYLSNLTVNTAALSPAFNFKTFAYTSSVPNSTTSVTVKPALFDATASSLTVNGTAVANKTASGPIALSIGTNTINITVIARDGITTQTYTITITRAPSTIATLSNLQISSGTLSPVFASGTTSYTATVATTTSSITVTPTVTDTSATVTVNGKSIKSNTASGAINLAMGADTIRTIVTAQDGATRDTYILIVTRDAGGTNNAYLANLNVTTATLSPSFAFKTLAYTSNVPNTTGSVTIKPSLLDTAASVKVNGVAVANKTASGPIALAVGANTINIVVTAHDGITITTYTVTITRAAAPVDGFDPGLSVNDPAEHPSFSDDIIVVHNGLSPNGDGINDFLVIDGIQAYPDNKLSVMNRNGLLIYEAKGYDNSSKVFDGHSNKNGQMQLPGTYFYQLDYAVDGITKHKTGFIVLKY